MRYGASIEQSQDDVYLMLVITKTRNGMESSKVANCMYSCAVSVNFSAGFEAQKVVGEVKNRTLHGYHAS